MRKDLLDEFHTFSDEKVEGSAYYKDSSIDMFLNKEFLSTIDPSVSSKVVDSKITITAKSSLGKKGKKKETVSCKVFLLSAAEIGYSNIPLVLKEGKTLKYFEGSDNCRIAYKDGDPTCWWLRSPDTWDSTTVYSIGPDGHLGFGGATVINPNDQILKSGVRPAFCMRSSQPIEKSDKIIEGQVVYVIAGDSPIK